MRTSRTAQRDGKMLRSSALRYRKFDESKS